MPRNGSGAYTLPEASFVSGSTISSTKMNSQLDDIATALTASLAKDGQTVPTANIPLGTYKLTGVGDGTAAQDAATLHQIQDQDGIECGTAGGTADALTLTPGLAITAYATGKTFRFISSAANTGAATVAVSGLAAKAIEVGGSALAAGNIPNGAMASITYDGTAFQLHSVSALTDLVTDTTPQLGGDLDLNGNAIDFPSTADIADCLDEDGMTSDSAVALATQQSIKAYVDASAGDFALITATTASSDATVEFTGLSSTYHTYELRFSGVTPASDNVAFNLTVSTDGGSTWKSSAYSRLGVSMVAGGAPAGIDQAAQAVIGIASAGTGTQENVSGTLTIYDPSDANYFRVEIDVHYVNASGVQTNLKMWGVWADTTAVDGIRLMFATGNIASGEFRLYGTKDA